MIFESGRRYLFYIGRKKDFLYLFDVGFPNCREFGLDKFCVRAGGIFFHVFFIEVLYELSVHGGKLGGGFVGIFL